MQFCCDGFWAQAELALLCWGSWAGLKWIDPSGLQQTSSDMRTKETCLSGTKLSDWKL